jgi:hypothetical protein
MQQTFANNSPRSRDTPLETVARLLHPAGTVGAMGCSAGIAGLPTDWNPMTSLSHPTGGENRHAGSKGSTERMRAVRRAGLARPVDRHAEA